MKKQKQTQKKKQMCKKGLQVPYVPWGIILVLFLCVFVSAILNVYSKHQTRQLVAKLQSLENMRDELHVEWSQLLLEQSTLASEARVERLAREKLQMSLLNPEQIVVVR